MSGDAEDLLYEQTTIRIVDDDPEIVETLSLMLNVEGWRCVGYASAEEFLIGDAPSDPGCVLLDIQMGGMSGIDLLLEMIERGYTLPVIFVTGHASVDIAVDAMRRGAFDFLQKPVNPERLLDSIRKAASQSFRESRHEPTKSEVERAIAELTDRQMEIVHRLLNGEKTRTIADELEISLRTVQGHKVTIYRKFGIHTATQFTALKPLIEECAL